MVTRRGCRPVASGGPLLLVPSSPRFHPSSLPASRRCRAGERRGRGPGWAPIFLLASRLPSPLLRRLYRAGVGGWADPPRFHPSSLPASRRCRAGERRSASWRGDHGERVRRVRARVRARSRGRPQRRRAKRSRMGRTRASPRRPRRRTAARRSRQSVSDSSSARVRASGETSPGGSKARMAVAASSRARSGASGSRRTSSEASTGSSVGAEVGPGAIGPAAPVISAWR